MEKLNVTPVKSMIDYILLADLINKCRFFLTYDTKPLSLLQGIKKYFSKQASYWFISLKGVYVGFFSTRVLAGDTLLEMAIEAQYRNLPMVVQIIKTAVSGLTNQPVVCEVLYNDYFFRKALSDHGFVELKDDNKTVLLIKYWQ